MMASRFGVAWAKRPRLSGIALVGVALSLCLQCTSDDDVKSIEECSDEAEAGLIFLDNGPDGCDAVVFRPIVEPFTLILVPDSVPELFQIDSLPVLVDYTLVDDTVSCGFAGPARVIKVNCIVTR